MRSLSLSLALCLIPSIAAADQPRGTYTFDRGALTHMTDGRGNRIPSCGGDKLFGGQATFVVHYVDRKSITVNQHRWEFVDVTHPAPGSHDSDEPLIIIRDPDGDLSIQIWFGASGSDAGGALNIRQGRGGDRCADAWPLTGKFAP